MNTVKLGSACGLLSGFPFKSSRFGQSGMLVVRIRDVVRGFSETFYDGEYDKQFLVDSGDILIGMDGDFNLAEWNGGKALLNQRVCKLLVDEQNWSKKFLYYYLPIKLLEIWRETPYVTVKHLSVKKILNIDIPDYPLETQKQIATILEKADQLRKDCQQMEQELNNLAQSVFMDMFGDPVSNPKGWSKVKLDSLIAAKDDIKCGPFGTQLSKSEFTNFGVPLWGIRNVNDGFNASAHEFVSQSKAKELSSYSIVPGDIVMTRKGNVGNCHIYPDNYEAGIMHSDLLRIRCCERKVDSVFLQRQLIYSRDIEDQLRLISQGAIMAGINVTKLKQLDIVSPPLEIQRAYSNKMHLIEKQKIEVDALKSHCQSSFSSLIQKAFNGQLTTKTKAA